jgi:HD-GYP domain-containing protein (c-di-GMP phosphodiesterase class II)
METSVDRSLPLDQAYQMADLNMYHEKLQNSTRGRRVIVDKLRAALQSRDNVDENRVRRVRRMAIRLAEMAGFSKQEITDLVLAADLRDMGQVGIPDRVLQKEGPLSGEEWEDIKSHPLIGSKIAKSWPELAPVADVILHHHERWDGHGYPDRLCGESIPIASRIIAVVDAFDAMTSQRPYRDPLKPEEALREIQRQAGSQFDPQMARMLADIVSAELGLTV